MTITEREHHFTSDWTCKIHILNYKHDIQILLKYNTAKLPLSPTNRHSLSFLIGFS